MHIAVGRCVCRGEALSGQQIEETATQKDEEDVERGRGDRLVFGVNGLYVCVGYVGPLPRTRFISSLSTGRSGQQPVGEGCVLLLGSRFQRQHVADPVVFPQPLELCKHLWGYASICLSLWVTRMSPLTPVSPCCPVTHMRPEQVYIFLGSFDSAIKCPVPGPEERAVQLRSVAVHLMRFLGSG